MKTSSRSITARLGLASALALGAAGMALAQEVAPEAAMQIATGSNQDAVRSQLGEPVKVTSYLFAPGKAWYYYVKGGTLGNEKLVQVNFDESGAVQSTQWVDASFHDLNRYE
jgi:outer membrane protein assembly factor BamE (lipoprotein component of BamABCDE complex)